MKTGTMEFDGIEYPDGNASDPRDAGVDARVAAAAR